MWRHVLFGATVLALGASAWASNTGGVFGPVVNEGHRSAQYRIALDDENHALAQRLHYQAALDDDLMWRVVGQVRKTSERNAEFDYLQGELFWQLSDVRPGWKQGLRFDLRARDDDRPHQFGANLMHEIELSEAWSARALVLSTAQFGDNRRSGVGLQSRFSLSRAGQGHSWSLSMFSDYGTSAELRHGGDQVHQLGPTLNVRLGSGWSLLVGGLFGLTDATPDAVYRVWLTRSGL